MFYVLVKALAWLVWHIAFRIKVIGHDNLIKNRGFILCPNHISAIDPVFVVLARYSGPSMGVLGKEELFEKNWFITWFLKMARVLPVARGRGDTQVLSCAEHDVQNGHPLLVFPEGTRTKDGNLGRLKSGAFVIADATKSDIVPCRIIYKGGKMRPFGRCTVVFGKAIPHEAINLNGEHSMARLRACKQLLTDELNALLEANRQYT